MWNKMLYRNNYVITICVFMLLINLSFERMKCKACLNLRWMREQRIVAEFEFESVD